MLAESIYHSHPLHLKKVVVDMEEAEGELHQGPLNVDTAVSLSLHFCNQFIFCEVGKVLSVVLL